MRILVPAILLLSAACSSFAAVTDKKSEKILHTFDLTYTLKLDRADPVQCRKIWDDAHFASSIQGIVNRNEAKLYFYYVGGDDAKIDRYWLDKLRAKGEFLADYTLKPISDLASLVKTFKTSIKGLVVYDENVASTSNVASTVAGVENLTCVRFDKNPGSLYHWLTSDPKGPKLPVKVWLVNKDGSSIFTGKGTIPGSTTASTGSAKCDAYIWAKEKYLDTGKCNPTKMGYYMDAYWLKQPGGYIPNHTLSNQDYFIAKKGFMFDLSPWDDEVPVDDKTQPIGADYKTLSAILRSCWEQTQGKKMIHVGGFLPWDKKYTNVAPAGGGHDPVPGEWRYAEILSCYNAYMDADALGYSSMANASVYCRYPLDKVYPQKLPTIDDLKAKGFITADGKVAQKTFITFYVGDYDSAAWLYNALPTIWDDPARGSVPLGWAFNPNLAERFAPGLAMTRKTKTPNDFFVAGDSGAGYVNPGYLVEPRKWSGLPSGLKTWTEHCAKWYKQFDLSITGFIIDGYAPPMTDEVKDAYITFSGDGFMGQKVPHDGIYKSMPFVRMEYDIYNAERDSNIIIDKARKQAPEFFAYRNILWKPSSQKQVVDIVKASEKGTNIEFVDPYTLMLLVKQFYTSKQKTVKVVSDLWDTNSDSTVTGTSGIVPGFDIRDMFGGTAGTSERDVVIFQEDKREPFTHWVEWKTPNPIVLESFKLYAHGDDNTDGYREFNQFRLFAKVSEDGKWEQIDAFTPTHPFAYEMNNPIGLLHSAKLDEPVTGQYFRAEFDQYDAKSKPGMGPRIAELQGFGKVLK
ncbi:MAG: GxGYxYP domain-containing protein [Armatimonadota bacterium]